MSGRKEILVMATMTELEEKLLYFPREERIYLVEKLLKSLNFAGREEIDKVWAEESEKRIDELETVKVQTISGEPVFQEIGRRISEWRW